MTKSRALTVKQKKFVEYYFITNGNATRAAEMAGYKGSDISLAVIGHENLKKLNIKAEIDKRMSELIMTADECLKGLSEIAEGFDITKYIEFEKTYAIDKAGEAYFTGLTAIPNIEQMQADGVSKLIKEVRQTNRGVTFVLHDKLRGLEDIARYYALFIDRKEVDVNVRKFEAAKVIEIINKEKKKLKG